MDWTGCEFVERVEGRCGGAPTVVGTRVFPDIIVDCLNDGMDGEDIWEQYPSLTPEQIKGLIAFVQGKTVCRVKVRLDENLSRRLRKLLANHKVSTVAYQGWRGIQNGALLSLAEGNEFEVLLTADRNIPYEQSLRGRKLAIVER